MRLIDADKIGLTDFEIIMCDGSYKEALIMLLEKIKVAPTVEERKTGEWNCGDDMFEYAVCSCCEWDSGEAWEYAKKYFSFCPNCGATMEHELSAADVFLQKGR